MSPSSPLYLLTLVGLMLQAEGQTLKDTNVSPGDAASVSIHAQAEFQDSPELQPAPATPALQPDGSPELQPAPTTPALQTDDSPELQPEPATPALQPDDSPELQTAPATPALQPDETTQKQRKTQSLMEDGVPQTGAPGPEQRLVQGLPPFLGQLPYDSIWKNPDDRPTSPPTPREETPFYYDEYTLRKRGLLIAAVLFITGIVILTSGKCRQLPQLCQKNRR